MCGEALPHRYAYLNYFFLNEFEAQPHIHLENYNPRFIGKAKPFRTSGGIAANAR